MPKTAVYSWRLSADLKLALEQAARRNQESVAVLLDRIVRERLASLTSGDEEAEQRRLRAAVASCIGTIDGGDPDRATRARETIRERLARRRDAS